MFKKRILSFTAYLFFIASFISLLPIWVGDLFSHFRMFWTVFSVVFLIIYIILFNQKKVHFKIVMSVFFSLFINFVSSYSFWTNSQTYQYLFFGSPTMVEYSEKAKQEIENDTTVKKLLLMNVLSSNTNYEEARKLIKNVDADFVVIIELNKKWENELKTLNQDYSYQFMEVREDNFGMGIYSKIKDTDVFPIYSKPTINSQLISDDTEIEGEFVGLEATCFNRDLRLVIIHPIPPINLKAYNQRNSDIAFFSKRAKKFSDKKFLLVGDLNCSPFSADYKKFLKTSGLKDSQENYGFQPTWNSAFPFLMQTQLDHVWHSEDIEVLHRQTLPIAGSDHKAVLVVFR
jgi:endonuclease/exonuclease/phosphatase (EEP) superfamily protein YafD